MNGIDKLVKASDIKELEKLNNKEDVYLHACYHNNVNLFKHYINQVDELTRIKGLVVSKNKDILFEILKVEQCDFNIISESCEHTFHYRQIRADHNAIYEQFYYWVDTYVRMVGLNKVYLNVYTDPRKEDYFKRLCKSYILHYTWDSDFTILGELNSKYAKDRYKRLYKELVTERDARVNVLSLFFGHDIATVIVSFICL